MRSRPASAAALMLPALSRSRSLDSRNNSNTVTDIIGDSEKYSDPFDATMRHLVR